MQCKQLLDQLGGREKKLMLTIDKSERSMTVEKQITVVAQNLKHPGGLCLQNIWVDVNHQTWIAFSLGKKKATRSNP